MGVLGDDFESVYQEAVRKKAIELGFTLTPDGSLQYTITRDGYIPVEFIELLEFINPHFVWSHLKVGDSVGLEFKDIHPQAKMKIETEPPAPHVSRAHDGSLWIEWIKGDESRFSIIIEADLKESSWNFVSKGKALNGKLPKKMVKAIQEHFGG